MIMEIIDKTVISNMKEIMDKADKKRIKELNYDSSFVQKQLDIAYIDDGNRCHLLDIYSTKAQNKNTPVIVNIHGGGLFYGHKELNLNFNCELVKRGFKVANLNYRLLPETTLHGQLKDIAAAFRFLNVNRNKYGLNFKKLCIVGDSAGGLLSYMFSTINGSDDLQDIFNIRTNKLKIKGLCLISTMLDTHRHDFLSVMSGLVTNEEERSFPAYSYLVDPARMATTLPKTLLITSAEDLLREESIRMYKILREHGVLCKLHDQPKVENYQLSHIYPVTYPLYKESIDTVDLIAKFFSR